MDARDRLRQYLEQRKELGESDLVLDGMAVDDLMMLLGGREKVDAVPARRAAEPRREPPTPDAPPPRAPDDRGASGPAPTAGSFAADAAARPAQPMHPPGQPISIGGSIAGAAGATFAGKYESLDAVAAAVAACTLCGLHAAAKHPVPGEGSPDAKFVCVGEAPGATEDETGRPFVGAAGQLLTKILEAIKFKREDVFICNVLKHRPPGNRNPAPDEIVVCSPYLMQQLALLKPRVILALGTFAAQTLLQTTLPIGKLRGQIHRFYGVPLVVTYHPAALLRNPNWKRPTWEDVQLARRVFDNPVGA